MRLWPFRRKALTASPEVVNALRAGQTNFMVRLGGGGYNQHVDAAFQRGLDATYGWMYQTQPAVRAVVDFLARNTAQLGLKLYERVSDTERERREDHAAALSLANPNGETPTDKFIYDIVCDYLVYGNAYVVKFRPTVGDLLTLERIPSWRVTVDGGALHPTRYHIYAPEGGDVQVDPADVIHWKDYNPRDPLLGLSRLETLRQELASDQATQQTLVELAKNGLRGGHIERPLDAPEWSEQGRERFQEGWRNQKRTREDPVLEEGMRYVQDSITPKDAELLATRRFTIEEVARVYGLPPGPLGLSPYQQMDEQRKQIYADVLPPITKTLACLLDVDILRAEYDEPDYYFEFDLNEKLRGDLENRFPAMTASVGRPWQTVNEARAKENLPPVDTGDELTIPLNVMLEGQGSPALPAPNVMPPQDPNKPPQDGSYREESMALTNGHKAKHRDIEQVLIALYNRQERAMEKGIFKLTRFNNELADDLQRFATGVDRSVIEVKAAEHNEAVLEATKRQNYREVFGRARDNARQMALTLGTLLITDPKQLRELGVPDEILWERAGFSQADIDRMRAMKLSESLLDAGAEG